MDEAAGAIRDAWQNNLVDDDASDAAIQQVGNKLIALGKTTESSTKEVSAAVSQMLRNGLADSADEAFDIIQRGVEQGVNKSDDLLDTFNEYGTQFRKFGLSAEDALGLMSQGLKAGARDADTVADSIKEFTLRATDGTAKAAGGYKMLGLNADKYQKALSQGGPTAKKAFGEILTSINAIEDPQKRTAAQLAFFGTKAEDMGAAIDGLDLDKAAKGLGNVAGAAGRAGKTLEESAGAKLESFKRKAQGALVEAIYPDTPAAAAGLRPNDVILRVEGVAVRNENHLINLFAAMPIGQRVKLQVWRDRRTELVDAVVGDWNQAQTKLKVEK